MPYANHKDYQIRSWLRAGLKEGALSYDDVYEIHMAKETCDKCQVTLTLAKDGWSSTTKCMDHDHVTGEYRATLCNSCNLTNVDDKKARKNNKLGIKNISKTPYGYIFVKCHKGQRHDKWFKTLDEAIAYKTEYLKNLYRFFVYFSKRIIIP